MKYVLVLDVAKGKSMFMLSSNNGEVLLEPTEFAHNKVNFELIDSDINKQNIKDDLTVVMEATSIYHKAPERFFKEHGYHTIVFNPLIGKEITNTIRKTKTDKQDCIKLTNLFWRGSIPDRNYTEDEIYTRLNEFEIAKQMYERAAEINHRLYSAHYNLGQIALIQKDLETAGECFENSMYDDLEAMSYYQLAKVCALKGEKDKAITFINKAIELEPKLLKIAIKERAFRDIKEYITVSVKMEKDENKKDLEETENKKETKSHILKKQERAAQIYLEETNSLIDDIKENTKKASEKDDSKQIEKHVSYIINSERLKRLEEIDKFEEQDRENEKVDESDD